MACLDNLNEFLYIEHIRVVVSLSKKKTFQVCDDSMKNQDISSVIDLWLQCMKIDAENVITESKLHLYNSLFYFAA